LILPISYWTFFLPFLAGIAADFGVVATFSAGSQCILMTRAANNKPKTAPARDLAASELSGGKSESAWGLRVRENGCEDRRRVVYVWREVKDLWPVVLL
jgi:hypothetical protein